MPNQPEYNRLRSVAIFKDLDKNELEIVHRHVFEQSVKKDYVLFAEGMPGELLYIIMSGCRNNKKDKRQRTNSTGHTGSQRHSRRDVTDRLGTAQCNGHNK